MNLAHSLAVSLTLITPWPCLAQFGVGGGVGMGGGGMAAAMGGGTGKAWSVKVETTGQQVVTGVLALNVLNVPRIACDFGILDVDPEKIKEIRLAKPADHAAPELTGDRPNRVVRGVVFDGEVVTVTGSTLKGEVFLPELRMQTDLGTLRLIPRNLRSITFLEAVEAAPAGTRARRPPINRQPAEAPDDPAPGADPKEGPGATGRPAPIPGFLTHPSTP